MRRPERGLHAHGRKCTDCGSNLVPVEHDADRGRNGKVACVEVQKHGMAWADGERVRCWSQLVPLNLRAIHSGRAAQIRVAFIVHLIVRVGVRIDVPPRLVVTSSHAVRLFRPCLDSHFSPQSRWGIVGIQVPVRKGVVAGNGQRDRGIIVARLVSRSSRIRNGQRQEMGIGSYNGTVMS